jgi:ribonuclease HI
MPDRRLTRVEFLGPTAAKPQEVRPLPVTPQARLDLLCRLIQSNQISEAQALVKRIYQPRPSGGTDVKAWFDGTCQPNPHGDAACGAIVKRNDVTIFSSSRYLGRGPKISNHVAEFAAIAIVFRFLLAEGIGTATVYGDSHLVIGTLQDEIRAKAGSLYAEQYREALSLRQKLPNVRLAWISRGQNIEADKLARAALPRARLGWARLG